MVKILGLENEQPLGSFRRSFTAGNKTHGCLIALGQDNLDLLDEALPFAHAKQPVAILLKRSLGRWIPQDPRIHTILNSPFSAVWFEGGEVNWHDWDVHHLIQRAIEGYPKPKDELWTLCQLNALRKELEAQGRLSRTTGWNQTRATRWRRHFNLPSTAGSDTLAQAILSTSWSTLIEGKIFRNRLVSVTEIQRLAGYTSDTHLPERLHKLWYGQKMKDPDPIALVSQGNFQKDLAFVRQLGLPWKVLPVANIHNITVARCPNYDLRDLVQIAT